MKVEPPARQTYIENLCFIQPLSPLRSTPNVQFFSIDNILDGLSGIDLVVHGPNGRSPLIDGDDTWYWYMHTDQEDKLVVHNGRRLVELYSLKHGQVEKFEVTANAIYHDGQKIYDGAAILGWDPYVFHRVHSPEGSVSTNYASRTKDFDLDTNFNIYQLDTETGSYEVARIGALDQPQTS
ncbi:hypothetical protein [Hydrogenovibrio kuenenii]|uniref:hypothetical protein n=1 Tax=Hydrogenovibrio kuenenii TaxID=63658 RepID=UPI000462EB61|nr:hypothetical protein [Hydrogenovibrio kuenenii]